MSVRIQALRQRAGAGDPRAQVALAFELLVGRETPRAPHEAVALVQAACAQNYTGALMVHAMLALLGFGRARSWDDAIDLLARAAALGDESAIGQLAVLGGVDGFDPAVWIAPPRTVQHYASPRLFTVAGFVPPAVCAWMMEKSRPYQKPAAIMDAATGSSVLSPLRTNSQAAFSRLEPDLVLQLINLRVVALTKIPFMHQEDTNVFRYAVGQEFKPHFDFLLPEEAHAFSDELERMGQRIGTFLLYLNDAYEGGETEFERLNWRYRGGVGDAMLFWNVSPAGELEIDARHAGLPVTRGEKWLMSKWMRARPVALY